MTERVSGFLNGGKTGGRIRYVIGTMFPSMISKRSLTLLHRSDQPFSHIKYKFTYASIIVDGFKGITYSYTVTPCMIEISLVISTAYSM